MKKINTILISAIVVALAVIIAMVLISRRETPVDSAEIGSQVSLLEETEPVLPEEEGSGPATAFETRPQEPLEIDITEPVYVSLPQEETDDLDLVFTQWDKEGDSRAKFQDVSQVKNTVAIPSKYGKAGETLTAEVRLCGQVELSGFDLTVTYDKELLKFVAFENADEDLVFHCDEETGTIRMNYLRMTNLEEDLKVCDLQFEILSTLSCETVLDVEMVEAISFDENGEILFCNYSLVDAKVYLNEVAE